MYLSYKPFSATSLFIFFSYSIPNKENKNITKVIYKLKTFKLKDSSGKSGDWGYSVLKNNIQLTHQSSISFLTGNLTFTTEKAALTTCDQVAKKIINNLNKLSAVNNTELGRIFNSIN